MQTKPRQTVVVMPNNKKLEVSYYCSNGLKGEHKNFINLIIQLNDCHTSIKIPKTRLKDADNLESVVQKTVINARGHLCD